MKLSLALCVLVGVVYSATADHHARHEIDNHLDELKEKFPQDEWQTFWNKLTEALGDQKGEFMQKLEANQGNMQMTLAEFRDKMQGQYPVINEYWTQVQTKWDDINNKLKELTIADVITWAKNKVQTVFGDQNIDADQMWDSARAQIITFYNQLKPTHHTRRHRRDVEKVNQALDEVEQKFPKAEWDAFWNKLTQTLGDKREEFQGQLESNQGNMDLTLTQFQDKLHGDYPALKQNWDTVQAKWDQLNDKVKTLTLSDIVNWVKGQVTQVEGQVGDVNTDDLWGKVRAFIVTYYQKAQQQAQELQRPTYW
jgi:cell division septum initiation protein DivIVA